MYISYIGIVISVVYLMITIITLLVFEFRITMHCLNHYRKISVVIYISRRATQLDVVLGYILLTDLSVHQH